MKNQPIEGSLVDIITKVLVDAGHQRPDDWKRYLHPDAITSVEQNIQRFLINRAWRQIIGSCNDFESMEVRSYLVDTGEFCDWLRLFKEGVLPCILKLNLPPSMN